MLSSTFYVHLEQRERKNQKKSNQRVVFVGSNAVVIILSLCAIKKYTHIESEKKVCEREHQI